jgi:hypothetical protein
VVGAVTPYLEQHRPVRQQWYERRNRPLTGCTVLHTAESVMDTVGPDTGAEAVAEFIRTRTTAGSYHDLCDGDSWVPLIGWDHGAFHDGTGSNNWALSISWACRTTDWRRMTPERRRGFLRQGARAFAAQQAYRRSVGAPLTELRRITKAQSDAGASGFIAHGDRDPGRRTDPGIKAPDLFPWDEWLDECLAAVAGTLDDGGDGDEDMYVVTVPPRELDAAGKVVRVHQSVVPLPGIVPGRDRWVGISVDEPDGGVNVRAAVAYGDRAFRPGWGDKVDGYQFWAVNGAVHWQKMTPADRAVVVSNLGNRAALGVIVQVR